MKTAAMRKHLREQKRLNKQRSSAVRKASPGLPRAARVVLGAAAGVVVVAGGLFLWSVMSTPSEPQPFEAFGDGGVSATEAQSKLSTLAASIADDEMVAAAVDSGNELQVVVRFSEYDQTSWLRPGVGDVDAFGVALFDDSTVVITREDTSGSCHGIRRDAAGGIKYGMNVPGCDPEMADGVSWLPSWP